MHIFFFCCQMRAGWLKFSGKLRIFCRKRGKPEMDAVFETEGTCLTIRLPGELDHPASEWIRRESDRIMGKLYIRTIVFDFGDTAFMDSSGIGLIMGRYRALGMRGNSISAVHVSSYIEKLLHLSGVHKFVRIFTGNEEKIGGEHDGKYQ